MPRTEDFRASHLKENFLNKKISSQREIPHYRDTSFTPKRFKHLNSDNEEVIRFTILHYSLYATSIMQMLKHIIVAFYKSTHNEKDYSKP